MSCYDTCHVERQHGVQQRSLVVARLDRAIQYSPASPEYAMVPFIASASLRFTEPLGRPVKPGDDTGCVRASTSRLRFGSPVVAMVPMVMTPTPMTVAPAPVAMVPTPMTVVPAPMAVVVPVMSP